MTRTDAPSRSLPLLIVNADDLGRSPGINRGIFEAHRAGVVTSATLMVGFAAAEEAAAALGEHPALGVGLHLTLSGAAPTLPPERLPHLVDADGLLPRRPERAEGPLAARELPPSRRRGGGSGEASGESPRDGAAAERARPATGGGAGVGERVGDRDGERSGATGAGGGAGDAAGLPAASRPAPGTGVALDRHGEEDRWHAIRATLAEVLAEVRHQLELFRRLTGRPPTHLDTHHHGHRILPVVLEAVVAVAREHGLPVRNASPEVHRRLRAEGLPTTDRFVESFYGDRTGVDDLVALLREVRGASTEVMCHPARVDEELTAASTYTGERERELATLTDPAVARAVEEQGWRLGHFGDLAGEGGRR